MKKRIPAGRHHGLDIRFDYLQLTREEIPGSSIVQADAIRLPYSAKCFDLVYSHFLFLWLNDPVSALAEMKRVTCPAGWVLALAEPDYGSRIDYPPELSTLGRSQGDSLRKQGADPCAGRKLQGWFNSIGFQNIRTGILGAEWTDPMSEDSREGEWEVIRSDLEGFLSADELDSFRRIDAAAWQKGERILYVPTFFAIGQVSPE